MSDSASTEPTPKHLDTTGTLCPVPILLTRRALADLPPGGHLEVVGDDPAMHIDFPAFCDTTGHRLLSLETAPDGRVHCLLAKRSVP